MAAAAVFHCSYSLNGFTSVDDISTLSAEKTVPSARFPRKFGTSFATGSPLLIRRCMYQRSHAINSKSVPVIRCNQGMGLDVWLGRLAMVGFVAVITTEISTGKGLLENIGLTAPLPTLALGVTAFVGLLTALFIFQSASDL